MKSVTATESATLDAWRVLAAGDRIGALLFNDTVIEEFRPQPSCTAVMHSLQGITAMDHALNVQMPVEPIRPYLIVYWKPCCD
jgi:hypothetical protein